MRIAATISLQPHADPPRDMVQHTYVPFLEALGLVPILIPNVISDPAAYAQAVDAQAVLLTGGGDVAPERYGEAIAGTEVESISALRDSVEFRLLAYAVERRLPVIGICRGMQMINVYFGGSLVQDIPSQVGGAVIHANNPAHPLAICEARFAAGSAAGRIEVNSFHHQGVTAARLSAEMIPFALSEADGIIEGIAHRALPVLGVQWHPERPSPSRDYDSGLLLRVLTEGAFWQKQA